MAALEVLSAHPVGMNRHMVNTVADDALHPGVEVFPLALGLGVGVGGSGAMLAHGRGRRHTGFFDAMGMLKQNKGLVAGGAGAAAGAVMYGMCKSKCPGAKGGMFSNIPGAGMLSGIGGMLKSGASSAGGALFGGGKETDDDTTEKEDEDEEEEMEKEELDPKYKEMEATEYSACRLNCKIKSLMAAAAAAGAAGMAMGDGPLDEWTVGPYFAGMQGCDINGRRPLPKALRRQRAQLKAFSRESSLAKWRLFFNEHPEQLQYVGLQRTQLFGEVRKTEGGFAELSDDEFADEDLSSGEDLPMEDRLRRWNEQLEKVRSSLPRDQIVHSTRTKRALMLM